MSKLLKLSTILSTSTYKLLKISPIPDAIFNNVIFLSYRIFLFEWSNFHRQAYIFLSYAIRHDNLTPFSTCKCYVSNNRILTQYTSTHQTNFTFLTSLICLFFAAWFWPLATSSPLNGLASILSMWKDGLLSILQQQIFISCTTTYVFWRHEWSKQKHVLLIY